MTTLESFLNDLKYLQDLGVKIKIYQNLQDAGGYVLEIKNREITLISFYNKKRICMEVENDNK